MRKHLLVLGLSLMLSLDLFSFYKVMNAEEECACCCMLYKEQSEYVPKMKLSYIFSALLSMNSYCNEYCRINSDYVCGGTNVACFESFSCLEWGPEYIGATPEEMYIQYDCLDSGTSCWKWYEYPTTKQYVILWCRDTIH